MGKVLRPVEDVSKARTVADPLAQFAAAGMIGQGLAGLGLRGPGRTGVSQQMINGYTGPFGALVRTLQSRGMRKKQAVAAALRIIYAQNLAGKKL